MPPDADRALRLAGRRSRRTEPGAGNRARLRFDGPARVAPRLLVYRTDRAARRVSSLAERGRAGSHELRWDGLVGAAGARRPAAAGNYVMVVRVQDAAGNVGRRGLPPVRGAPARPSGRARRVPVRARPARAGASGRQVSFAVAARRPALPLEGQATRQLPHARRAAPRARRRCA